MAKKKNKVIRALADNKAELGEAAAKGAITGITVASIPFVGVPTGALVGSAVAVKKFAKIKQKQHEQEYKEDQELLKEQYKRDQKELKERRDHQIKLVKAKATRLPKVL